MPGFENKAINGLNVQVWGRGRTPVVVLHGGPGSGLNPNHTGYFDPDRHQVILFDQRGCGRSGVPGSITANTTSHLISDIETIRAALQIPKWVVLGGSWGGTLALAYAQAHPDRVQGLIVRGALVAVQEAERWMLHGRAARYPAGRLARDLFLDPLDAQERETPVAAWFARMGEDEAQAQEAARRVMVLESAFHGPEPGEVNLASSVSAADIARSRIYLWYWMNSFFLPKAVPAAPQSIAKLPHHLIHGAQDLICPIGPMQDYAASGNLNLEVVADAGHDGLAPAMVAAIQRALAMLAP